MATLQRRRERYIIIHVWKIYHGLAPNDIGMEFHSNPRLGIKANVPSFKNTAQRSISTAYENSFAVNGARLWNTLPKEVNTQTSLNGLKSALGVFLKQFPDNPPVPGYTPPNDNSLTSWKTVGGASGGQA